MNTNPDYWQKALTHLNKDKVLKSIIKSYKGESLTRRNTPFLTLARAITGQQISVKAADSVWKKLLLILPEITPEAITQASIETLRSAGLSERKAQYMKALAVFDPDRLNYDAMSDEEVIKALTSINGIGSWTAEMFLIFCLLRPNVFPIKDIGVQKAIKKHYGHDDYLKASETWHPYRTVATWYLWRSLDPVPVKY